MYGRLKQGLQDGTITQGSIAVATTTEKGDRPSTPSRLVDSSQALRKEYLHPDRCALRHWLARNES
jgi:hypothetical protein